MVLSGSQQFRPGLSRVCVRLAGGYRRSNGGYYAIQERAFIYGTPHATKRGSRTARHRLTFLGTGNHADSIRTE